MGMIGLTLSLHLLRFFRGGFFSCSRRGVAGGRDDEGGIVIAQRVAQGTMRKETTAEPLLTA